MTGIPELANSAANCLPISRGLPVRGIGTKNVLNTSGYSSYHCYVETSETN